jgi:hypothetical protein
MRRGGERRDNEKKGEKDERETMAVERRHLMAPFPAAKSRTAIIAIRASRLSLRVLREGGSRSPFGGHYADPEATSIAFSSFGSFSRTLRTIPSKA